MLFTAYNLVIESAIPLPELHTINDYERHTIDVTISLGSVSQSGLKNGQQLGPFLWAEPNRLFFEVPSVGSFLIENGKHITIDPIPQIDEKSIRVFLLGSAFGALLIQRGHLVLHGNAIQIGDQCLICVGHSGAGKSTLAAGFMQRGFNVLSDDVVPIDERGYALPGFPRIKLWQQAADHLSIETFDEDRIRPELEKFSVPVIGEPSTALPVRWIYLLQNQHIDNVQLESIEGMNRFLPLRQNTYRIRYVDGMGLNDQHMKQVGQLASKIRLTKLTRPKAGFVLEEMMDAILDDLHENP